MFAKSLSALLLLALVATLGCEQPSSKTEDPNQEADSKYWSLADQVQFSGWASGDCHVGKKVYVWGHLSKADEYLDGKISFVVERPDGTKAEPVEMETQKLEESADPNYGNTWMPTQVGRHRITFRVTPNGGQEQLLTGVVFDVN